MGASEATEFDVVVVGGGPGGSTAASFVAMRGHRVLLLEREVFPRYQIGESLLPATVHGIGRLLGVHEELAKAGFTRKLGGTFRWGSNPEPWSFFFSVSPHLAGPTSYAYQVERMKFDDILLKHSRKLGVDVREGCAVQDVVEEDGRIVGVRYEDHNGLRHEARARFVVDASGNRSRIYQNSGSTRVYSDFFRNVALFGYFRGGKRLPSSPGNIFCEAFPDGWFWYIPLSDSLTSVGAVINRDAADQLHGDQEAALMRLIDQSPRVRDLLSDATRVTDGVYGQIRVRKDYSYLNSSFWGKGMALVGDSACFVDPVFSTGVHLATYGGLLVARSINSVLAGRMSEDTAFHEFEARYRREYGLFYEFLMSYYAVQADEQSYYWQAKQVTRTTESELEAFVALVGGVASQDTAFASPESARQRIAGSARELEKLIDINSEQTTHDDNRPLLHSAFMADVMGQQMEIQATALFGGEFGEQKPLFPGGLVTSKDGLLWEPQAARPADGG